MRPVVSVAEMAVMDARAMETVDHEELVNRAGYAVAHQAGRLLGRVSGRRVVVLAGPGSNGADGRVAARILAARGASTTIVGPTATSDDLRDADLVIDAAFGTGLSRPFVAPTPPAGVPVLAIDLPSGLDGDTGKSLGEPMAATLTVTMAAAKIGLFLGDGPRLSGEVVVADIGIPTDGASMGQIDDGDILAIPQRRANAHKWSSAVTVFAGSPGMEGAASLTSLGALRSGAGMVRLVSPGSLQRAPLEVVAVPSDIAHLAETVAAESARAGALIVGPGLGRELSVRVEILKVLTERAVPVVLDADGLAAIDSLQELAWIVAAQSSPILCTPHDGELTRLIGHPIGEDRIALLRRVVAETGAIFLSKGPTTVIVTPEPDRPDVVVVDSGTQALATAGTGDVLSGVIAALAARGVSLGRAAALGAFVHGRAGARSRGTLVASELPGLIGEVLKEAGRGS